MPNGLQWLIATGFDLSLAYFIGTHVTGGSHERSERTGKRAALRHLEDDLPVDPSAQYNNPSAPTRVQL
jgi:hypothetical protein